MKNKTVSGGKGEFIIIIILLFLSVICILGFIYFSGSDISRVVVGGNDWKIKKNEPISMNDAIPSLLYHNIDGKGRFSITLDSLRSHFRLIKGKNIRVISLRDFIERLENREQNGSKSLTISFDDGYPAAYSKLMPLAKEFNYPVTLFIYTDNIFNKATASITWKKIIEMQKHGIDTGCHSISHVDLVKVSKKNSVESRRRLFEEIYLSKRIMELYLKRPVDIFAFPFGSYNLEIIDLCKNAGYRRVFSTDYGPNITTMNNYCLRRRHIKNNYTLEMIEELIK